MAGERNPVGRGFAILYWMAQSGATEATLSEIATGVDMLPSTIHRVLGMLENENLVSQDTNRGRYSLGPNFYKLARSAAVRFSLREVAQPWVEKLRDNTGETAWFATLDSRSLTMMFRASAESPHELRIVRPLDEEVSLFRAGASGHVAMAYLPEKDREHLLASPDGTNAGEHFTDSEYLQKILDRGYEVSSSATTGGMGIAAPVLSDTGRLLGVLGIGLPQFRCDAEREAALTAEVKEYAEALAKEI